jgi:hypothetical protein
MKNILTNHIDYLNFEDGEMIHSIRVIRATRNAVVKLIYISVTIINNGHIEIEIKLQRGGRWRC